MQRSTIFAANFATRKLCRQSSSSDSPATCVGDDCANNCKQSTSDFTVSNPRIETASAGLVIFSVNPHAGELTSCNNRAVSAGSRAMTSAILSTLDLGDSAL